MGTNHFRSVGSKNSVRRLSDRIFAPTSILSRYNYKHKIIIRPYVKKMRIGRSRFFASKKCYRISIRERKKPGILQSHICNPKEGGWQENDIKCQTSEQIHKEKTFQNANGTHHTARHPVRRLGSKIGSQGCILSYPHSRRAQTVPAILSYGKIFPVQGPLFRSINSTKSVYKDHVSSRSISPLTPDTNFSISRRLAHLREVKGRGRKSSGTSSKHSAELGTGNKLGEIQSDSVSAHGVSRNGVRPTEGCSNALTREISKSTAGFKSIPEAKEATSPVLFEDTGANGRFHRFGSLGSPSHETNPTISSLTMAPSFSGPGNVNRNKESSNPTLEMVAIKEKCSQRHESKLQQRTSGDDHRCLKLGLGSPCKRAPDKRDVGPKNSGHQAYKLAGNAGSVPWSETFREFNQKPGTSGENRQYNSSFIPQQTGRYKVPGSMLSSMGSSKLVPGKECNHQGGTHTRKVKCNCRQTIKGNPISADRMVTKNHCSHSDFPVLGKPSNRPVCISTEQETPNILFSSTRSECPGSRCLHDYLGGRSSLRISTSNPVIKSTEKDTNGELHYDPNCATVAQTGLVSNDLGVVDSTPSEASGNGRVTLPESGESSTPRPKIPQLGSMETIKRQNITKGFSERVASTMASARRESTSRTYDARINRYRSWCEERNVDPISAPVTEVAEFLQDLFDKNKFTPSTIAGYKSAISLVHQEVNGVPLGQVSDLCKQITGMYQKRPTKKSLVPNWSLPLVLNMLNKHPFEPLEKADIKYVTLKTVFLVAVASGRRVSEIHALSADSHHLRWECNGKGVRLLTNLQFVAKNEAPKYPGRDIFLASFDQFISSPEEGLMCPCRALSVYLKKTKPVRNLESRLFLTFKKGSTHGASKDTISRWLVQTVKSAYELAEDQDFEIARAHDTRSLSTSWALFHGVSMEEIMRAAFWAAETTFTSFYMKDVIWDDAAFSLSTLKTAKLWKHHKRLKAKRK